MIIDLFKHCILTVTVTTNGSEGLLIHCLKPNHPCATAVDQLKGLYYVVLQERQDPSESSETLNANVASLWKYGITRADVEQPGQLH